MSSLKGASTLAAACAVLLVLAALAATDSFAFSSVSFAALPQGTSSPSQLSNLTVQSYNLTVPSKYQSQFTSVQNLLNQFNASLGVAPVAENNFTYAAELLIANGNQGPNLLAPTNLGGVQRNLNALKAMNVSGVTIALGYPLLDPTFPNSTQYLQYFKTVVAMCHQSGFTVDIESQLLFANTPYSPLSYNWSALSYSDYVTRHIAQDNLICAQIKPDILEIGVEADTEAALTGYTQLNSVQGWTNYINQLLNGINKNGTKLAAGAGDWQANTTSWVQGFANNSNLDFISTHSYPVVSPFLSNLISLGQFAQQIGKPLIVDEEWCTKVLRAVNGGGGGGFGGPEATQTDVFSFWIPVDTQFQQLMAKFSQIYNCAYLSPFDGDYYFFAYLTWTPQLDNLTFFQLHDILNPIVTQNMANFTVSPTGAAFAALASAQLTPSTSPSPSPTASSSPQPSATPTLTPNPTQTPTPTPTFTPAPTVTASPTSTATPTPSPAPSTPAPSSSAQPSTNPTSTPSPTSNTSSTATPSPSIPEFTLPIVLVLLAGAAAAVVLLKTKKKV